MEGPAFLPDELRSYESIELEDQLFQSLIKKPVDFTEFFEFACADETWCDNHIFLIRSMLRWSTKAFYLNELPFHLAKRIASTIQDHFSILSPFLYFRPSLFFNMTVTNESHSLLVNSLLFGVASPYFWESFKQRYYQFYDDWKVEGVPFSLFKLIAEHIQKGKVETLWKLSHDEVLALMKQARQWILPKLVTECSTVIRRYITADNVIETLLQAHKQLFAEWKQDCYNVFNQQEWGLRCLPGHETDLRIEILDDKQETIDLLERLAPSITHLAFSRDTAESPYYEQMIEMCPKLIGADFSGSDEYIGQFDALPEHLTDLSLSNCAWLDVGDLKDVAMLFPKLKRLSLQSNSHLNYLSWGMLNTFRKLTSVNVSYCQQLVDEDLKLIVQACPNLNELQIEECREITDNGIFDVIQYCKNLTILNMSRCDNLTDKSLIELGLKATQLRHLEIARCTKMTDEALIKFFNFCHSLKFINIQYCNFSDSVISRLKRLYPMIEIK